MMVNAKLFTTEIILTGYKDPTSNLWTLLILPVDGAHTTHDAAHQSPLSSCVSSTPHHAINFSYYQSTKENNVNLCTKDFFAVERVK
jgi:hypothetical protein